MCLPHRLDAPGPRLGRRPRHWELLAAELGRIGIESLDCRFVPAAPLARQDWEPRSASCCTCWPRHKTGHRAWLQTLLSRSAAGSALSGRNSRTTAGRSPGERPLVCRCREQLPRRRCGEDHRMKPPNRRSSVCLERIRQAVRVLLAIEVGRRVIWNRPPLAGVTARDRGDNPAARGRRRRGPRRAARGQGHRNSQNGHSRGGAPIQRVSQPTHCNQGPPLPPGTLSGRRFARSVLASGA